METQQLDKFSRKTHSGGGQCHSRRGGRINETNALRASGAERAEDSAYTQSPAAAAERPHAVVPTDRGNTA